MWKRRSFASGLELLTSPKTFVTLLVGSVSLGVLGNAVSDLLTNWLTDSTGALLGISLGALLVFCGFAGMVGHLAERLRPALPLPNKQPPHKRRGLIVLVSNEPTAQRAILWHHDTLQYCWLVCSEQSMPVAIKLKNDLHIQGKDVMLVLLNDVFDLLECRNKVNAIYNNLPAGLSPQEIILDFTGMTSMASVGAVLACMDEQRSLQYTPAAFDDKLQATRPRDPVEVVLTWGAESNGTTATSKQGE